MYKVMIVEDEDFIRQGIKDIIEWDSLGLEVIHMAKDGVHALELWEQSRVDIVISDLNMPRMGGLDLLERIREKDKKVRFIILTGYDDFEYARKAIRIEVENYILKPIDEEQLTSELIDTTKRLEEQKKKEEDLRNKNTILLDYLTGKMSEEEEHQYIQINQMYTQVVPAFMKINLKVNEIIYIDDVIQYINEKEDNPKAIYYKKDELLILKQFNEGESQENIKEYFELLQEELEEIIAVFTFIAIGDKIQTFSDIKNTYNSINQLRKYFIVEGYGSVVDKTYLQKTKTSNIILDKGKLHKLILERNRKGSLDYIEELFVNNLNTENISIEQIYKISIQISVILENIIEEFKLEQSEGTKSITQLIEDIYQADNISVIKSIFCEEINEIIEHLKIEDSNFTPVIRQIISEVSKIYAEDMNLKTLAHKYNMNTSYLGQIFQKEVGCSFSQYLSNMKNSKARELILNTNMRINDIAKEVGYPDTSYFYRKFKQCYGISPASLREMKKY